MANSEIQSPPVEAPILADDLALDLLNTEAGIGIQSIDFWQDGADVVRWLQRVGVQVDAVAPSAMALLLSTAKELRATARELITLRKAGAQGDPQKLNSHLARQQSVPVLEWTDNDVRVVRKPLQQSPLQALDAVTLAVAKLLAEGDFSLVRQCEHPDCVMWFYDKTKSHRRRWCSMAICGNRHKAAEFRKRNAEAIKM